MHREPSRQPEMRFQVPVTTLEPALFDMSPPIITSYDTARTRKDDPVQSHMAADRSQATKKDVRQRVLRILADSWREMDGNEINAAYAAKYPMTAHFDSGRKRAGELATEGMLHARKVDDFGRPLKLALYSITAAGWKELDRG